MTTYDSGAADPLVIGCPVYTADGDEIGHVKEVRGRFFKVDAPMRPDYWLSRETVSASQRDAVTLAVDKDHLGEAKVDAPDERAMDATPQDRMFETPAPAAREGLLTSYPPNAPVGMNDYAVPMEGAEAPVGATTWNVAAPTFHETWTQRYGSSGRVWEQAEPGYRYGYEMASDPRFAGRDWGEVEGDLGAGYEVWLAQSGFMNAGDDHSWQDAGEFAHDAWDWQRNQEDGWD